MFTGIITDIGKVKEINKIADDIEVTLEINTENEIYIGQSISCDGVCLSVTKLSNKNISFYISKETISRTIIKNWHIDYEVNIEFAMIANGRFDGHMVSGHIDNIAIIEKINKISESYLIVITLPKNYLKYVIDKGSICLNGVSLTVNKITQNNIEVNIIPITWKKTNLKNLRLRSEINFEVDILAKYLEKLS